MTKAIIFDFDGVIVSSELPRIQFIKHMISKRGYQVEETEFRKKVGLTTQTFIEEVLTKRNAMHLIEDMLQEYQFSYRNHITPIKQTVDFIKNYKGPCQLAVASMSTRDVLNKVLKAYGIYDKFSVVVSREDVKHYKPDPEVYLRASKKLNVSPNDCIVLEDSQPGVTAALTAGMKCFVVLHELNTKEEFADKQIEGFITSEEDFRKVSL